MAAVPHSPSDGWVDLALQSLALQNGHPGPYVGSRLMHVHAHSCEDVV